LSLRNKRQPLRNDKPHHSHRRQCRYVHQPAAARENRSLATVLKELVVDWLHLFLEFSFLQMSHQATTLYAAQTSKATPAAPATEPLTDLQSLDGLLRCQAFLKDCTTAKVVTVDAETAEGEMGPELSLIQVRGWLSFGNTNSR
jgi:hypothetical protein